MSRSAGILAAMILGAVVGCTKATPPVQAVDAGPVAIVVTDAAAPRPTVALARVGDGRTGATVVLARWGDLRVAFVADADDKAVRAVDLDARRELSVTPLSSAPAQLLVAGDGRLLVALRDEATVAAFHATDDPASPLVPAGHAATAIEPIALAATPDDATVLVASGWGHALESFALGTLERAWSVDLGREPRAVTTSADGTTAFVAHAAADHVTAVGLHPDGGNPVEIPLGAGPFMGGDDTVGPDFPVRVSRNAFALARLDGKRERIFVPHTSVDPGNSVAFSRGYGGGAVRAGVIDFPDGPGPGETIETAGTHAFDVDTIDPKKRARATGARMPGVVMDLSRGGKGACLLPRAAAVDAAHAELLVACLGIDEVRAYDATKDDPTGWKPRRKWSVPAGADGIAVDAEHDAAVVWSSFDGVVSVLPLARPARGVDAGNTDPVRIVLIRRTPLPGPVALGRKLFFDAGNPRIAKDGRACASCHIDGREDGLVWSSPDGPRQTMMLAGRVEHPPPFGWLGEHATVQAHLAQTLKNLGGTGLEPAEVDALVAWLAVMKGPPSPLHDETPLEARGRELFATNAADCATCHVARGGVTDDRTHDVGSAQKLEKHGAFVTPSLRYLAGTAPYFHDGRYATLEALLKDPKSRMGGTAQLGPADVDALAAFLRTL